jgi:hypothetical protein
LSGKRTGGLNHNPLLGRTEPPSDDTRTPVDPHTRVPVSVPEAGAAMQELSEKASKFTFYFTPQQLERLDNAWEIMRRRSRGQKQRPSKSRFVRVALDRLLDDFERNPEGVMDLVSNE